MIRCDSRAGRLVIRSWSSPTALLVLLFALLVPYLVLMASSSARAIRVMALECDRNAGRCRLFADDVAIREIPLAGIEGVEVRQIQGRRQVELVLATRSGEPWRVVEGEYPPRLRRVEAELERFLSGAGSDRMEVRWDHSRKRLITEIGTPVALIVLLAALALPTICTVDRTTLRVRVRFLRERELPLDAIASVRVQTGAEEAEELRRRTGRTPARFGPWGTGRRADLRRIVLVGKDGSELPVTAWLLRFEDPGPVAERLRGYLSA